MDAAERLRGWRHALSQAGLVARDPFVGDWSPQSGHRFGQEAADAPSFTAVFSSNDQMALGAMFAFAERGIRVPDDVSIVGFDDIPESAYFSPPLTTVHQDFAALGSDIMATVLELLADGEVEPEPVPHTAPTLVARLSAAPPSTPLR